MHDGIIIGTTIVAYRPVQSAGRHSHFAKERLRCVHRNCASSTTDDDHTPRNGQRLSKLLLRPHWTPVPFLIRHKRVQLRVR